MVKLCNETPLPIALDEELIGKVKTEESIVLLIGPQYIILKPTLYGELYGASEWIEAANERGIGWWITSALESNVGLNAVAHFVDYLLAQGPQVLGTWNLFTNIL